MNFQHGAIIDYPTIIGRVEKTGYFTYSGDNFNYSCVNTLPLMNRREINFNITFHHIFEEFKFLSRKSFIYNLLSREMSQILETQSQEARILGNESLSEIETETLYAMNSLGIKDSEKIDSNLKNIIKQIANIRLSRARRGRAIADSIFG